MQTPIQRNSGLFTLLAMLLFAGSSQAQGVQVRIGVRTPLIRNGPVPDFAGGQPGALLPQVQFTPVPGYEISVAKRLKLGPVAVQPEVKVSLYRIGYKLVWTDANRAVYGTQTNVNTVPTFELLLPFREPLTEGRNAVSLLLGPYMQVRDSHYTETSQGSPNTIFPAYQRERLGIEDKYRINVGVATGAEMAMGKFDVRLLAQFGKTALFSSNWQQYKTCVVSVSAGYNIGRKLTP